MARSVVASRGVFRGRSRKVLPERAGLHALDGVAEVAQLPAQLVMAALACRLRPERALRRRDAPVAHDAVDRRCQRERG